MQHKKYAQIQCAGPVYGIGQTRQIFQLFFNLQLSVQSIKSLWRNANQHQSQRFYLEMC